MQRGGWEGYASTRGSGTLLLHLDVIAAAAMAARLPPRPKLRRKVHKDGRRIRRRLIAQQGARDGVARIGEGGNNPTEKRWSESEDRRAGLELLDTVEFRPGGAAASSLGHAVARVLLRRGQRERRE